jgi:hypothetical protein
MTEADLVRIESPLGAPLPAHYRNLLLDHAADLRTVKTRCPDAVELYLDADEVIRQNAVARDGSVYIQFGDDNDPWPADFLLVGGFPESGDHVLVHLDSPRERVWGYSHAGGHSYLPAEFASWAEYLELVRERVEWWERYDRAQAVRPAEEHGDAAGGEQV